MSRSTQTLAATTDAVDWDVYVIDEFNVPRIDIVFDSAPTSAGLITVTKDSADGAAYDTIVHTENPVGRTSVYILGLHGFAKGDKINVSYANPDGVSVTASATVEIPLFGSMHVDGMTFADGTVRSNQSKYRRYYHFNLLAADPGASGATYTSPTSNYLGGMRLDAATDVIQSSVDIHGDWDTSVKPTFEAHITTMVAGTDAADIIKFNFVLYYGQPGVPGIRTQTFTAERTVGLIPQYTFAAFELDIDTDVVDNPIYPLDHLYVMVNLAADSDIDDVIINHASFYYATTHVGLEEGDV